LKQKKLGKNTFKELETNVIMEEELPNSLREMKGGQFNLLQDTLNRFEKRNLIEPRTVAIPYLSHFAPVLVETYESRKYKQKDVEKYLGKNSKI